MVTKTRIANKTLWALDDIVCGCQAARAAWQILYGRATRLADPAILLNLARVSDQLARIESTARDARNGIYKEIQP
jgi:hypothetical protein